MSDISIGTLMMAIQAVKKEIARLENLLTSETLTDGADVQDLLLSYEEAESELKGLYIEKQKFTKNYPSYESL
ncbi:hypothetical protein [Microbulbifer sp.]|uniref:hypothetical protein n=1 Tax=Microbulbifer sp. TaxID=1908541 RepID=UPI003F328D43